MGDFKRSPSGSTLGEKATEERPFISKSPSNSSFGFENTFRVLESQVSQNSSLSGDDNVLPNNDPPIVTTLELELGAVARLQQFHYYSTPKNDNKTRSSRTTTVNSRTSETATRPEDCDRYLEFLNQFIKKSRQKVVKSGDRGVPCDKAVSITISGDLEYDNDDTEDEPGLVEFGEYPELVYCIAKDKTGRYRLQSKDQRRIKSPQRTAEEDSNEGINDLEGN